MHTTTEIIIPVHNTLHLTKKCIPLLTSLIDEANEQSNTKFDITVIDDGSSDGTGQWIKENYPGVNLLKGDGNLWWSGAITKAAEYAFNNKKDFILLWNNDIVPKSDYFPELSKLIQSMDKNTIVGSKICDLDDPSKIWSMGGIFNPRNGEKYMLGLDKKSNFKEDAIIEPDWLTGMGTLIPREVTEKIGFWNYRDFPLYHGDSDFTYRAKKAGVKLLVYPQLVIYNDTENTGFMHGGSLSKLIKSFGAIRSKYNLKKEWKFYRLHANSWKAYMQLFYKYFKYTAGFFKWKVLHLFGKKN